MRLLPWWDIYKRLAPWFYQAGFPEGSLKYCPFWNVQPEYVGERALRQSEIREGAKLLSQHIQIIKPKIVIALGRAACHALVPRAVEPRIGGIYRMLSGDLHYPVICFPHPSGRNRMLNGFDGDVLVKQCVLHLQDAREELICPR